MKYVLDTNVVSSLIKGNLNVIEHLKRGVRGHQIRIGNARVNGLKTSTPPLPRTRWLKAAS
jgi:hypothetical protein